MLESVKILIDYFKENIPTFFFSTFCFLFFLGSLIFIWDILSDFIEIIKKKSEEKKSVSRLKKNESVIDRHLKDLINANNLSEKVTVFRFKAVTILLFSVFFLISSRVIIVGTSLIFSLMISAIPYTILLVRLEGVRSKASHEAEALVSELAIKYRAKQYNIEEAIEETIKLKKLKRTKPILARLLLKLRNTRNEKELQEAIRIFSYSIGTNWAKMLGSNIYQASVHNINISLSLEDMLIQLRDARNLWENQKRNTAEPRRMLLGIPIIYFVLVVYMTIFQLDVPVSSFLNNQFNTQQGITLFVLIVLGFSISSLAIALLFGRKFDF